MPSKTYKEGQIKLTLGTSDAEILMELVRATHGSRTRVIRNALRLYQELRAQTQTVHDVAVCMVGGYSAYVPMPWQEDWSGLPERVEDHELSAAHADPQTYRDSQYGGRVFPQED